MDPVDQRNILYTLLEEVEDTFSNEAIHLLRLALNQIDRELEEELPLT